MGVVNSRVQRGLIRASFHPRNRVDNTLSVTVETALGQANADKFDLRVGGLTRVVFSLEEKTLLD